LSSPESPTFYYASVSVVARNNRLSTPVVGPHLTWELANHDITQEEDDTEKSDKRPVREEEPSIKESVAPKARDKIGIVGFACDENRQSEEGGGAAEANPSHMVIYKPLEGRRSLEPLHIWSVLDRVQESQGCDQETDDNGQDS
jgi:hypothetical protein